MTRILSVTAVKDEGPYLPEWLAWGRMIGITDFILVSNDCSDGTDRMLDLLMDQGVVTHLRNTPQPGRSIQWSALHAAWRHPLRKSADWMLVSDVDEFPLVHAGDRTLTALIEALPPGTDAITLPWRLFGTADARAITDQPVTARSTRAAPPDMVAPIGATFFKSLFRPAAFRQPGVHRPQQRPDSQPAWVDGSGRPMAHGFVTQPGRLSLLGQLPGWRDLVELHHHSLRSLDAFLVKSARGLPNHADKAIDLRYWVQRNFDAESCEDALALQPRLRPFMDELHALPGISALHREALAWHQAQAERIRRTSAGHALMADCLIAGPSRVPTRAEAMGIYREFQQLIDRE